MLIKSAVWEIQKPSNESIPFKPRQHHRNCEQQTQTAELSGRKGVFNQITSARAHLPWFKPSLQQLSPTDALTHPVFIPAPQKRVHNVSATHPPVLQLWTEHVFSRNGQNITSPNKTLILTFCRGKLKAVYCTSYVTWTTSAKQLQRSSIKSVILSVLQAKTAIEETGKTAILKAIQEQEKEYLNMALGPTPDTHHEQTHEYPPCAQTTEYYKLSKT